MKQDASIAALRFTYALLFHSKVVHGKDHWASRENGICEFVPWDGSKVPNECQWSIPIALFCWIFISALGSQERCSRNERRCHEIRQILGQVPGVPRRDPDASRTKNSDEFGTSLMMLQLFSRIFSDSLAKARLDEWVKMMYGTLLLRFCGIIGQDDGRLFVLCARHVGGGRCRPGMFEKSQLFGLLLHVLIWVTRDGLFSAFHAAFYTKNSFLRAKRDRWQ